MFSILFWKNIDLELFAEMFSDAEIDFWRMQKIKSVQFDAGYGVFRK